MLVVFVALDMLKNSNGYNSSGILPAACAGVSTQTLLARPLRSMCQRDQYKLDCTVGYKEGDRRVVKG